MSLRIKEIREEFEKAEKKYKQALSKIKPGTKVKYQYLLTHNKETGEKVFETTVGTIKSGDNWAFYLNEPIPDGVYKGWSIIHPVDILEIVDETNAGKVSRDTSLDLLENQVLFGEKLAAANSLLKKHPFPKGLLDKNKKKYKKNLEV
jgi:hypothetical protein